MWLVRTNLKRWKTKQILSITMSDNVKIVLTCKLCIVEMKHLFNSSWWNTSTSALPYLVIKGHKVRSATPEYFIFFNFFFGPCPIIVLPWQSVSWRLHKICNTCYMTKFWMMVSTLFHGVTKICRITGGSCGFQIISN